MVRLRRGEAYLQGCHVGACSSQGEQGHEAVHDRKLLLHRAEIQRLTGKAAERGLTLVPLRLYFHKGRAKVELGLAKGKRRYGKRESIRRRQEDREMRRAVRNRGRYGD